MDEKNSNLPNSLPVSEQPPAMEASQAEENGAEAAVKEETSPPAQAPLWKKVLSWIWNIAFICLVIYGVRYYYDSAIRDTIDEIAVERATSVLSDLKALGIPYTLEPADKDIPKAEKYAWRDIRDGGGKAALAFQMMMYSDDFPDTIKTGKPVKYLNFTHEVNVYVRDNEDLKLQYVGCVDVDIVAFYQGSGRKGILYYAYAQPDSQLKNYIDTYTEAQEQQLFEQSFELQDTIVDLYDNTITIYYKWTNLRDTNVSPFWSFDLNAYQIGYELLQDYLASDTDLTSELQPGYTGEYSVTYHLRDSRAPVTLVVANTYGDNFFEDNPPTMEFEISLSNNSNAKNTSSSENSSQPYSLTNQSISDFNTLYAQFQKDYANGNYTYESFNLHYDGEEVREYRNYDHGEILAELTLYDFGSFGEIGFYALGESELHYDISLEGMYTFDGYTVDHFQFTDYYGNDEIRDIFVFRSGDQEWLLTWNIYHESGIVYTFTEL